MRNLRIVYPSYLAQFRQSRLYRAYWQHQAHEPFEYDRKLDKKRG